MKDEKSELNNKIRKDAIMTYIKNYGEAAAQCERCCIETNRLCRKLNEWSNDLHYWISRKDENYAALEKIINHFLEDEK